MLTRAEPGATLAVLVAEVRELRARLARVEVRTGGGLSTADRDRLVGLLPVWTGVLGSAPVSARELLAHPSAGLRLALTGIVSAKSLGKLLRRGAGVPLDGRVLEQAGREAGAGLWSVREVVS